MTYPSSCCYSNPDHDLWPSDPKIGAPITPTLGNVHTGFVFLRLLFQSLNFDNRTGQMDRQARQAEVLLSRLYLLLLTVFRK